MEVCKNQEDYIYFQIYKYEKYTSIKKYIYKKEIQKLLVFFFYL